jgi:hypothetical protein
MGLDLVVASRGPAGGFLVLMQWSRIERALSIYIRVVYLAWLGEATPFSFQYNSPVIKTVH